MLMKYVLYIYPLLFLLPLMMYFLIARPKLFKSLWLVYLTGVFMVLSVFIPIAGMSHWIFLIIWLFAVGVLLIVHAVVWLMAAFKKKSCRIAAIMTGITVIVSGILIGNWLAVFVAFIFFLAVFRHKFDIAFE